MAFSVTTEADWILLENGTDNLQSENAVTNLALESATALDLTAYIAFNTVTMRFKTLDFALWDPPAFALHLREDITVTDPAWSGQIVALTTSDPTERIGNTVINVTATRVIALPSDTAPFDLSETPGDSTFLYLQEDGTSKILLEAGTDFSVGTGLLRIEGALSYGYRHLQVANQINLVGPPTVHGRARVYQPGLRPGNNFQLTSTNQGYTASPFQITQTIVTWPQNSTSPWYEIEFGDTPQTLAKWTQITAPSVPVAVSAPVVIPSGPVIYANAAAGYALWPMGGGVVTIASATFSTSAPTGHTQTVQILGQIDCRAYAWDNYIATPRRAVRAILSGAVFTGAWQETPGGTPTTAGARAVYDLSSAPAIALPDGSYTVSIQIDTQEFNQMEVFSAWVQASVTVV